MQTLELFKGEDIKVEEVRFFSFLSSDISAYSVLMGNCNFLIYVPAPHTYSPTILLPPSFLPPSLPQILACANGDRHSSHRASFACAIFFEAQQDEDIALPLLYKAAGLDSSHPSNPPPIPPYLTRLARVHLRQLQRRLMVQGPLPPSRAPAPWGVASFWTRRYKAGRAAMAVRYSSSC